MSAQMHTLPDGSEALVITTGTHIEVFALSVIASYSELLGEPDPGKTVVLIRGAMKTEDQSGMWQPLYEKLSDGLGELSRAGVPPELMPDLMEETTAPVPRDRTVLRDEQDAAKARLTEGGDHGAAEFSALLAEKGDVLKESRIGFLKDITPPLPEEVVETTSPFEEKEVADGRPSAELEEGGNGQVV